MKLTEALLMPGGRSRVLPLLLVDGDGDGAVRGGHCAACPVEIERVGVDVYGVVGFAGTGDVERCRGRDAGNVEVCAEEVRLRAKLRRFQGNLLRSGRGTVMSFAVRRYCSGSVVCAACTAVLRLRAGSSWPSGKVLCAKRQVVQRARARVKRFRGMGMGRGKSNGIANCK